MAYSDKMLKAAQEFKNTNQKSKLTKGVTVTEVKPKEDEQKTYVYQKNADGTRTLVKVTTPTSSIDTQKTYVYQKNADGTRTLKGIEEPTVTKSTIFTGSGKAFVGSQQSKTVTTFTSDTGRGMSIDSSRFNNNNNIQSAALKTQTISNKGMSVDTSRTMNKSGFGLSAVEQLNRVPKRDTTQKIVSGNEYASYLKDKGAINVKTTPQFNDKNILAQISTSGYYKGVETKSDITIREDALLNNKEFSSRLSHELGHYDEGKITAYDKQTEDYAKRKAKEQLFLVPGNAITGSLFPMRTGIIQVGGKSQISQSPVPKFTDIISKQTTNNKQGSLLEPKAATGTYTEAKKTNFLQSLEINFASTIGAVNKNTLNLNYIKPKENIIKSNINSFASGFLLTDEATRNVNINNPISSLGVGLGLAGGLKLLKYGYETSGQALKVVNLKTTGFLAEKVSPFFKTGWGQFTTGIVEGEVETEIILQGKNLVSKPSDINIQLFKEKSSIGRNEEIIKVSQQPKYKQLGYSGLGIFTADSSVRLAGEQKFLNELSNSGISKEEQGKYLKYYRERRTYDTIAEPVNLIILSKTTEIAIGSLIGSTLSKTTNVAIQQNKIANFMVKETLPKFVAGGAIEGGYSQIVQDRIREQPINWGNVGFSAGAGALTGGVFGTAIATLPLSDKPKVKSFGTVTMIAGYTTDLYEGVGDLAAKYERKAVKKVLNYDYGIEPKIFKTNGPTPVFTFSPILTPSETKTNVAGIIKNPSNTQIQTIFNTPIKTPSNIFSFTSVNNPITTPNNINNPTKSNIYNPIFTPNEIPINTNIPLTNNINTMINIPVVTPMPRIPPMLPISLDLGNGGYGGGKGKNKVFFGNEAVYAGQIFKNTLGGSLKPLQSYETKRINKQIKELKERKKEINQRKKIEKIEKITIKNSSLIYGKEYGVSKKEAQENAKKGFLEETKNHKNFYKSKGIKGFKIIFKG